MKKILALLIIILVFALAFNFLGVSRSDDNEEILLHFEEQLDSTKEKLTSFLTERKDNIEKEIEREKDNIEEEAKGFLRGMWDKVTNFVFNENQEDIDNEEEE